MVMGGLGLVGLVALVIGLGHSAMDEATRLPLATTAPKPTQTATRAPTTKATTPAPKPTTKTPTKKATTSAPKPTRAATKKPTTKPQPTKKPTAKPTKKVVYVDDGYKAPAPQKNPPPLPTIRTYDQATRLLRQNSLYGQTVPRPIRCTMPRVNTSAMSNAQRQKHLNALTSCLIHAWHTPLRKAGYQAVRPTVTIYSGTITTKCGKSKGYNAHYCSADQQIYFADNLDQVFPWTLREQAFMQETVLAHEFAHAMQARTGILISNYAWQEKLSKAAALELNRRMEVQADCLAAQFMNSVAASAGVTPADRANIVDLFGAMGDDARRRGAPPGTHGTVTSRMAWSKQGLAGGKLSTCNTYTVDSKYVR